MNETELQAWKEELERKHAEVLAREFVVAEKERDLAIYENRVRKLYAEAFPNLEMKLRV